MYVEAQIEEVSLTMFIEDYVAKKKGLYINVSDVEYRKSSGNYRFTYYYDTSDTEEPEIGFASLKVFLTNGKSTLVVDDVDIRLDLR